MNSIERIDANDIFDKKGYGARWELVNLEAGNSLPARGVPLLCQWSSDEIICLGGLENYGVCKGDAHVVNFTSRTVQKCFDSEFKFSGDGN